MLADVRRTQAFREAIRRVVRPGDVVIDLGTGTGVLALWAAQAGASRVFAIEETDVATLAEAVIAANGGTEIITVLSANSIEVNFPGKADVLLAN